MASSPAELVRDRPHHDAADSVAARPPDQRSKLELRRAAVTALIALVALNIADVLLTRAAVARDAVELNPLARQLLASNVALAVKLAVVALLAIRFARRPPDLPTVCFAWLVTGIYTCVVIVNGATLTAS